MCYTEIKVPVGLWMRGGRDGCMVQTVRMTGLDANLCMSEFKHTIHYPGDDMLWISYCSCGHFVYYSGYLKEVETYSERHVRGRRVQDQRYAIQEVPHQSRKLLLECAYMFGIMCMIGIILGTLGIIFELISNV